MSEGDAVHHISRTGETSVLLNPNPKKRKIRKGTQSCWECKRRKIRCTFTAPTESVCDGCKSRRTNCTRQEFQDDAALASTRSDRLSRMESLVEQLVKRNSDGIPDTLHQNQSDQDPNAEQEVRVNFITCSYKSSHLTDKQNHYPKDNTLLDSGLDLSIPIVVPKPSLESQLISNHDELSQALIAVWPNDQDLNLIINVPVALSRLYHGLVFMPYTRFMSTQVKSPRQLLQLPPPGSHPVLIARKLLILGSYLRGIPPCSVGTLVGMKPDYRTIMARVVNTAIRLVTSNDDIVGNSLEGIECVMLESLYFNNSGNLRHAWLVNRKSMLMAQMMDLHTGDSSPGNVLEADTRDRIDPNYMWFRQVLSDRYLSLVLGLPQGWSENIFASPTALQTCSAIERMERMDCVAAGLIIQRKDAERLEPATTFKIDKILQDAAAFMSPQWWTPPDPTVVDKGDAIAFEYIIRLTNQLAHYHLLIQLHLPYMMQPSSTHQDCDYSKMTAASASRAIIVQFVSIRSNLTSTIDYCRGIDFVTFVAGTTLCLAHIEARHQHPKENGIRSTVLQSLQHQRLSDRGLLERTLQIMETTAQNNHDVITQKISRILKRLFTIEDNSAKGASYNTSAISKVDKQDSFSFSDESEVADVLRFQIPYFGTIKIEKRPTEFEDTEGRQTPTEDSLAKRSTVYPTGHEISNADHDIAWQTIPSYVDPPYPHQLPEANYWDQSLAPIDFSVAQDVPVPEIDDWALQGVDMALFSSLTNHLVDSTENSSWTHPQ